MYDLPNLIQLTQWREKDGSTRRYSFHFPLNCRLIFYYPYAMAPIGAAKQHEELFSEHHRLTAMWLVIFYHLKIMWTVLCVNYIQNEKKNLEITRNFLHYIWPFFNVLCIVQLKTICVHVDSVWYFLLHAQWAKTWKKIPISNVCLGGCTITSKTKINIFWKKVFTPLASAGPLH